MLLLLYLYEFILLVRIFGATVIGSFAGDVTGNCTFVDMDFVIRWVVGALACDLAGGSTNGCVDGFAGGFAGGLAEGFACGFACGIMILGSGVGGGVSGIDKILTVLEVGTHVGTLKVVI